jgi:ubiquinone/menaquinone biosynthesis C-methylase UbiE
VTDQQARYDHIADGYARWWSPVHRPATLSLLDRMASYVEAGATRILDVGCGTGALAATAVRRWPGVAITGLDVSAGMLAVAERELAALPADARERIRLVQAPADRLPFADGAFDLVVSSFVLQLVPSPYRALREARRVLAEGGSLAIATWLAGGSLAADDAYADALTAAGLEPVGGGTNGDPATSGQAAARLRRAGFRRVFTMETEVDHQYTPESYLAFLASFDDEDLFASLDAATRSALEADLLARLRALPPAGLRLRLPVVVAMAERTGRTRGAPGRGDRR